MGADDSDDEIVSKTTILESTEAGIKWVPAWIAPSKSLDAFDGSLDFLKLFFFCPLSLQGVIFLPETANFPAVVLVHLVGTAFFPFSKVFLDCSHETVHLMEIHIRQDWSTDSALRYSAVSSMKLPILQEACFETGLYEAEKA